MQDIYLASLRDRHRVAGHDIRFVEDNWENPSLGAAGLGWEVWLDGMEITQFTYFQQAGGIELDPISVELAYGLERLAMYLQGVERVQDMRWSEDVSWADVYFQNERQMSTYNYELADTAMHARHFDEYEAEGGAASRRGCRCRRTTTCSSARTPSTCSIRARAIAVTDRAAYVLRMRRLAQAVAAMYLEVEEHGA